MGLRGREYFLANFEKGGQLDRLEEWCRDLSASRAGEVA
jgi:hypothetical protein